MAKTLIIALLIISVMLGISIVHAGDIALYILAGTFIMAFLFMLRLKSYLSEKPSKSWVYLALSYLFFFGSPLILFFLMYRQFAFLYESVYFTIVLTGLSYTFFYDFVHIPLSVYHKYAEKKAPMLFKPRVTFLVPSYNEEKGIGRTIESLLDIDYLKKEILVIDDGSDDATAAIASKYEPQGVKVIRKKNSGKASSINYGLNFANGEIVITIDADSLINKYAVNSVIRRFQDENVMAVCGNVKVLNRVNSLTKCQALEYITDINLAKRAFDIFGSTMVVPGVFGAFRKSAFTWGGKMDPDTLTEDFDMTLKALKAGGVVQATNFALAFTEAPEKLKDLYKQRLRWYEGTFQTLLKHRDVMSNPKFGMISELGFPYILLSMVFVPIVGFICLGMLIFLAATGFLYEIAILVGLFMVLETLLAIFSIRIDEEDYRLALFAPLFVIGYRHIRDLIKLKALYNVIFNRSGGWQRVTRTGRADEMLRKLEQGSG